MQSNLLIFQKKRPSKTKSRFSYGYDRLSKATQEVMNNTMTMYRASKHFGVPKVTLLRRITHLKKGETVKSYGKPRLLPPPQEQVLANHCIRMREIGCHMTR